MKEIGHALPTAVLEIVEQQESRLQWESTPKGVILDADDGELTCRPRRPRSSRTNRFRSQ